MYRSDLPGGLLDDVAGMTAFLTLVLYFAQDRALEIPLLDVVQTLFCWPSLFEGILTVYCLWSCRVVLVILGDIGFRSYLVYQFLTYLLPFIIIVSAFGFRVHFSLLNFIPYSLFVFVMWRIPVSFRTPDPITGKDLLLLVMSLVIIGRFPFSLAALASGALGYFCWKRDVLAIRKIMEPRDPPPPRESDVFLDAPEL